MRKLIAASVAAVALSGSIGLATAAEAAAAAGPPRCVKVVKYYTQQHHRYVRLKNLCAKRDACYAIVISGRPDPRGRLAKGATKDVRYGTDRGPRATYVKTVAC